MSSAADENPDAQPDRPYRDAQLYRCLASASWGFRGHLGALFGLSLVGAPLALPLPLPLPIKIVVDGGVRLRRGGIADVALD